MVPVLKVLVVDDEDLARDRIKFLLQRHAERNAVREGGMPALAIDTAADGIEAIEKIKEHEPDLLFLDIQMPEVSGFDVLLQFPLRRFEVILQTAYSEFAIKAFEVAAADYLLKPFPPERFEQALNRALARLSLQKAQGKAVDAAAGRSLEKSFG